MIIDLPYLTARGYRTYDQENVCRDIGYGKMEIIPIDVALEREWQAALKNHPITAIGGGECRGH